MIESIAIKCVWGDSYTECLEIISRTIYLINLELDEANISSRPSIGVYKD